MVDVYETRGVVGEDRKVRLEFTTDLPPGPVDVVVVVAPVRQPGGKPVDIRDFYGIGKGLYEGMDIQEYINLVRNGGDLDEYERRARQGKKA